MKQWIVRNYRNIQIATRMILAVTSLVAIIQAIMCKNFDAMMGWTCALMWLFQSCVHEDRADEAERRLCKLFDLIDQKMKGEADEHQ